MLYSSGAPSAYAEGNLSTNAGFSTPVMLPNEEGYYPYWGFKTPNIVETSADGTTWTVVDPTGYRSMFAFQNGSSVNITTRFLRITFYQPTYTFLALISARFVGGTNNKPITMKTELLGSDYSTIVATFGPTGGVVGYDGAALMQKFNSYNGSTNATRVTFDMALWSAGDTYQISSLMAYMSKPGTGFGFQNKFPMLWDVNKTTTFQPSQPGAKALVVKAATTLTSTITNAVANGTTITYTTSSQHGFLAGYTISITGIVSTGNPSATAGSGFNLTGATIAAVLNQTQFTVTNSLTDTYTSGGTLSVGQGANLTEWQNSGGTVLSSVNATGTVFAPYFRVGNYIIDNADTGATLNFNANGTNSSSIIATARSATQVPFQVKAAASQSADLQRWTDSSGAVSAKMTSGGALYAVGLFTQQYIQDNASTAPYLNFSSSTNKLIANARNAGYVAFTVQGASSQTANLTEWQNSAGTVLARIKSDGTPTFSYMTHFGRADFTTDADTSKGIVVKGFSATQSANLQEWQNSAGTVLSNVTSGGIIRSTLSMQALGMQSVSDGSQIMAFSSNRNLQIGSTTGVYGGGEGVIGITNATTVPTSSPTGGGILYVDTGALKYRGTSGSAATVVNADGTTPYLTSAVTSVGMTVPTGLSVTPSTITSTGTFAVSLASGYSIPTTTSQTNWDTAYGWGNHSSAGYLAANNGLLTSISTVGGGGAEGGQINFARVTDGAAYWYIDSYGTSATPDLRFIENATERFKFAAGGVLYVNGSAGTSGQVLTSSGTGSAPTWTTVSASFTGGTLTSNLTLAAGTTSLSPLTFQSGTNLTTVTSGAREYDGTVFYQTSNTTPGRALDTQNYYYISNSTYTLDFGAAATAQSILGGTTTGITLAAGTTYEYELLASVQHTFVTSNTVTISHNFTSSTVSRSPTLAYTQTIDYGNNTTSFATATTMSSIRSTTAAGVAISPAVTTGSRYCTYRVKGTIRVTGTGSAKVYPSLTASATTDNTVVVQTGAIFKLTPIGNGTVTTVGAWS